MLSFQTILSSGSPKMYGHMVKTRKSQLGGGKDKKKGGDKDAKKAK
jgi:hypothetical protein